MEYAYYAKLIKDGFHTQCTLDLESGAVKIQDVPFEFRNTEAYEAAHLYARTIKDEKERHDAYWQIQNSWNQILYNARPSTSGGMVENIGVRR